MTWTAALSLLRKFWPALPIAALAVYVAILTLENRTKAADLKVAEAKAAVLQSANDSTAKALAAVTAQRVDNDAIATAVAAKLGTNTTHETTIRTTIEKAVANDPKVAAWADTPVPDSVRAALRSNPQ